VAYPHPDRRRLPHAREPCDRTEGQLSPSPGGRGPETDHGRAGPAEDHPLQQRPRVCRPRARSVGLLQQGRSSAAAGKIGSLVGPKEYPVKFDGIAWKGTIGHHAPLGRVNLQANAVAFPEVDSWCRSRHHEDSSLAHGH
jgi:hypothetical protein